MTRPEPKSLAERLAPHRGLPGISGPIAIRRRIEDFLATPILSIFQNQEKCSDFRNKLAELMDLAGDADDLTIREWMTTLDSLLPKLENPNVALRTYADHTRFFYDQLKTKHHPAVTKLLDIHYQSMMGEIDSTIPDSYRKHFHMLYSGTYTPEGRPNCRILCVDEDEAWDDFEYSLMCRRMDSDLTLRSLARLVLYNNRYHPIKSLGGYLAERQQNWIITYLGFFKPLLDFDKEI